MVERIGKQGMDTGRSQWPEGSKRVGTAKIAFSSPKLRLMSLTHRSEGHHAMPALDIDSKTLLLPYGATAGLIIETNVTTFRLLATYLRARGPQLPALIYLRTGGTIVKGNKSGNSFYVMEGGNYTTISPYQESDVSFGGLHIHCLTETF